MNLIPGSYTGRRHGYYGPNQNRRNEGLEDSLKCQGSPPSPWILEFLQAIYQGVLTYRKTAQQPSQEGSKMDLGKSRTRSVRQVETDCLRRTGADTTRSDETIRSRSGHVKLRNWRCSHAKR